MLTLSFVSPFLYNVYYTSITHTYQIQQNFIQCSQVDKQSLDWMFVCSHPQIGLTAVFGSDVGEKVAENLNVGAKLYAASVNTGWYISSCTKSLFILQESNFLL